MKRRGPESSIRRVIAAAVLIAIGAAACHSDTAAQPEPPRSTLPGEIPGQPAVANDYDRSYVYTAGGDRITLFHSGQKTVTGEVFHCGFDGSLQLSYMGFTNNRLAKATGFKLWISPQVPYPACYDGLITPQDAALLAPLESHPDDFNPYGQPHPKN